MNGADDGWGYDWTIDTVWPQMTQPYVKNWAIHRCPSDPNENDSTIRADMGVPPNAPLKQFEYAEGLTSDLGYNYMYLSPMIGPTARFTPQSQASLEKPATTLMLADSIWDRAGGVPKGGGNWFIEAPSYWYSNTEWWFGGWQIDDNTSWLQYGATWPRHTNAMNVAFTDGHVKIQRIGNLLAGVNPRTYQVFDKPNYIWSRD
jgi:prepilin-type processing-associated H-X9-DG protein